MNYYRTKKVNELLEKQIDEQEMNKYRKKIKKGIDREKSINERVKRNSPNEYVKKPTHDE